MSISSNPPGKEDLGSYIREQHRINQENLAAAERNLKQVSDESLQEFTNAADRQKVRHAVESEAVQEWELRQEAQRQIQDADFESALRQHRQEASSSQQQEEADLNQRKLQHDAVMEKRRFELEQEKQRLRQLQMQNNNPSERGSGSSFGKSFGKNFGVSSKRGETSDFQSEAKTG